MMAHVVLFTPRADLDAAASASLADALQKSLDEIPSVRRYQVGRRVKLATTYDREAPIEFEYLVVIEFDDRDGLGAYLRHPRHEALGSLFYSTSDRAGAADFETVSGNVASVLSGWAVKRL